MTFAGALRRSDGMHNKVRTNETNMIFCQTWDRNMPCNVERQVRFREG